MGKRDGRHIVRSVAGAAATKAYSCPGCGRVIDAGIAHVVAWPAEGTWSSPGGVAERRHWHTGCWERRP